MRAPVLLIALLLTALPLASGHTFNHESRHEDCDLYGAPQDHFIGDGHAHTHDAAEALELALHNHDPCKQIKMDRPAYEDVLPISALPDAPSEIDAADLVFGDGDSTSSEVAIAGEAYRFSVGEGQWKEQSHLVVLGDLAAAGMGFPGSGTQEDPYIIEGYVIRGNMILKDTAACYVVRNNIVVAQTTEGPFLPDPDAIVNLRELDSHFEALLAAAEESMAELDAEDQAWDELLDAWLADAAAWRAESREVHQQWRALRMEHRAFVEDQRLQEAALERYIEAVQELADAWTAFSAVIDAPAPPAAPEPEQADAEALEAVDAFMGLTGPTAVLQEWVDANPAPATAPAGWTGSEDEWIAYQDAFDQSIVALEVEIAELAEQIVAHDPNDDAFEEHEAAHDAYRIVRKTFLQDYAGFRADHRAILDDHRAWVETRNAAAAAADETAQEVAAHLALSAAYEFLYDGELGMLLHNTVDELVDFVLDQVGVALGDAMDVADATGRLVLDWNGQCLHVHSNVIHDLRVNQNNDRLGYATGGIIEDNRIHTVGQIRHYDGIFRDNEVGNRAHLLSLIDPEVDAPAGRTINNDGANQGWFTRNIIYGQTDLDFHGHHHGAGFFAPESHYHGSAAEIAYMQADGVCKFTYDDVSNGKEHDDNDVDFMSLRIERPDEDPCLPHMDHAKRWTSVRFTDNLIIDPEGVGLRFEDRNHRGDDEQANSENMEVLKKPHFHQKWVQIEDNVVVGKIFIDVLNGAGTDLWSDDWSPVLSVAGPDRIAESLAHPGATIVNSHPGRNDAWLDIQGNTIFATQHTAVWVRDAEDMTLFQFKQNNAHALPVDFDAGRDFQAMRDWFQQGAERDAQETAAELDSWGGEDRGPQQFAVLQNVRDGFEVQHCANTALGFDAGFVAKRGIVDDGQSIIAACGASDFGNADPAVDIRYTTAPPEAAPCHDVSDADPGDDFHVTETVLESLPAECVA